MEGTLEWRVAAIVLAMSPRLIRCKKCRRPFSAVADCCPDCRHPSPRAALQGIIKVASIIVAVIALGVALTLAVTHLPPRDVRRDPGAASAPLHPPEDDGSGDISFAPR